MRIGIIKEIKDKEARVSIVPEGAEKLLKAGHRVVLEQAAGIGSGYSDSEYQAVGVQIVNTHQAWSTDLVVKVKEPMASEYHYLNTQMVFTFFHLAGSPKGLTETLLRNGTTAIAYETLEDEQGCLPLLAPMSAVAGNMAVLMGAYYLADFNGGKGTQLGKVLGKQYGKVIIIGDGVVGLHAAQVAHSMGAEVILFGLHEEKGRYLTEHTMPGIRYLISNRNDISAHLIDADLVIGAVLIPGAKAPYVVTEDMVTSMPSGSVIVDVSIDQGGCIETSRPTTHSNPVFIKHDVLHYCVTNIPGAYPKTATLALADRTLPYIMNLANNGLGSFIADEHLNKAINTFNGMLTCRSVAEELGMAEKYKKVK